MNTRYFARKDYEGLSDSAAKQLRDERNRIARIAWNKRKRLNKQEENAKLLYRYGKKTAESKDLYNTKMEVLDWNRKDLSKKINEAKKYAKTQADKQSMKDKLSNRTINKVRTSNISNGSRGYYPSENSSNKFNPSRNQKIAAGVAGAALLGGAAYAGYRAYKKRQERKKRENK